MAALSSGTLSGDCQDLTDVGIGIESTRLVWIGQAGIKNGDSVEVVLHLERGRVLSFSTNVQILDSAAMTELFGDPKCLSSFPAIERCVCQIDLADLLTGAIPVQAGASLDSGNAPHWRNLYIHRKPDFDIQKAKLLLEGALHESPPPSFLSFQKRAGHHYATLRKRFPDLCQALCACFQQYRAATINKRRVEQLVEFRQIAEQLHREGIDLFLNRVLKRMSPPKSMDYRIARDLFSEVKGEILAAHQPAPLAVYSTLEEQLHPIGRPSGYTRTEEVGVFRPDRALKDKRRG